MSANCSWSISNSSRACLLPVTGPAICSSILWWHTYQLDWSCCWLWSSTRITRVSGPSLCCTHQQSCLIHTCGHLSSPRTLMPRSSHFSSTSSQAVSSSSWSSCCSMYPLRCNMVIACASSAASSHPSASHTPFSSPPPALWLHNHAWLLTTIHQSVVIRAIILSSRGGGTQLSGHGTTSSLTLSPSFWSASSAVSSWQWSS